MCVCVWVCVCVCVCVVGVLGEGSVVGVCVVGVWVCFCGYVFVGMDVWASVGLCMLGE